MPGMGELEQSLPRGIGVVIPCASEENWRLLVRIMKEAAGISPVGRRDSGEVKRALYAPSISRAIINVSSASILARLGYPTAALTVEAEDPRLAAEAALELYHEHDRPAEIVDGGEVELGIPSGFMYFVLAPGFPPILFWPAHPDPELVVRIPRPEPWTD